MSKANLGNALKVWDMDSIAWGSNISYIFLTSLPSGYVGFSLGLHTSPTDTYTFESNDFESWNSFEKALLLSRMAGLSKVVGVTFTAGGADSIMRIGAIDVTLLSNGNGGVWSPIYGFGYTPGGHASSKDGDFWLTTDGRVPDTGYSNKRTGLVHEFGHTLGLSHDFNGNIPGLPATEQNNKYTIMTYTGHPGEFVDGSSQTADEFQIYDIAALQSKYGVFRDSVDNVYTNFSADGTAVEGGVSADIDRITSIWDGGGIDRISSIDNASAYIDLRPGFFSSIGPVALADGSRINDSWTITKGNSGNLGTENVSIAFGAYIENATGSSGNDVIVGNMLTNQLVGLDKNDMLFADGLAIDEANALLTTVFGRASTGLISDGHDSTHDADYREVDTGGIKGVGAGASASDDRSVQQDTLDGGLGNDLLVGAAGSDVLIGGQGNNLLIGGAGIDEARYEFASSAEITLERTAGYVHASGLLFSDSLFQIEKIVLTDYDDKLIVRDMGDVDGQRPMSDLIVHMGRADTGHLGEFHIDDDMIDLLQAGKMVQSVKYGVRVDLRDTNHQTIQYLSNSVITTGTGGFLTGLYAGLLGRSDVMLTVTDANSLTGTAFNDVLIGNAGKREDGEGYSTLRGGGGDDFLAGRGWESHLFGDGGKDQFSIGAKTFIEDAEVGDTVDWGLRLYGGVSQWWQQSGYAYWAPFTSIANAFPVVGSALISTAAILSDQVTMKFARYQISADGSLIINLWGQTANAVLKNYNLDLNSGVATGGVTVFQAQVVAFDLSWKQFATYLNLALNAGFGAGFGNIDPLVLDLDGDGFNLTAEAVSNTYFEFDSDGFAERTGWLRGTDGFLVRDTNANGKIDNITEMFGNATTGGFDMLAGYDSNADGIISAADAAFSQLSVWQDADQDGVTDAGELKSLTQLGIQSISLTHAAPAQPTAIGGNVISQLGSFTWANGSTGKVADVALEINQAKSKWLGDNSVDTDSATLPQLTGFGEIRDLRVAMSSDSTLKSQVSAFVANPSTDVGVLEDAAEAILYRWAGVDGVATTAIGANGFDTRKLAFLEKYSGYELMPRVGGVIQLDNLEEVETLWGDQLKRLTLRLVVQGPLADTFDGITYRDDLDMLVADSPNALADLLHNILVDLPTDPTSAAAAWQEWAPLLGVVANGMIRSDSNTVTVDFLFTQLLRAADGVTQPLSIEVLATALNIPNLRIGTGSANAMTRGTAEGTTIYYGAGGNDTLTGGSGQDVYVFGHGVGHTTITDIESSPAGDRIRFAFHDQDEVSLERDGVDLLITVIATGETVRVTGQFADVIPQGSDLLFSTNKGVEDIQFADGSIMEIPEIMAAVGKGSDGDDHLVGTMHSDVLTAGKGNDIVEGGDDADLYVFNRGDGNDIYREAQSTVLLRAADLLVFGDDVAPDELVYARAGATGDDLLVTLSNGGGSILIEGQFAYTSLGYNAALATNTRIEVFAFREYGDSFTNKELQQQLIAAATTDGNDTTRGFGDDDFFGASIGNDVLIGMDGADTYNWSTGAGNDTIREEGRFIDVNVGLAGLNLTVRADTVQFSDDISLEDLVFTRPTAAPDLVITNLVTGETLTVANQFAGFQTGVLGAQWFDRVEWFAFADGSRISWKDVTLLTTTGGAGNDQLWGDVLPDTMTGNEGDDTLSGLGGGDTYVFGLGDGHDTINDDNTSFLGDGFLTIDPTPDVLQLGPGILPGDISFERNGSSIDLIIGSGGDRVTLAYQDEYMQTGVFGALSTNRIEQIRFDNGTIWSWQELNERVIASQTTSGNDVTQGFTLEDRFEASAGNDTLRGGDSGDTYVFGVGSGHDRIEESVTNVLYGDGDIVEFAPGVLPGDVSVARDGSDLVLTLTSGDTLRIAGEFAFGNWFTWEDVEYFRFANGVEWTKADIQQRLLTATAGNDHLVGFMTGDVLDGGAGNDVLEGGDGSDTYRFGRGGGDDEIRESLTTVNLGSFDRVVFGAGIEANQVAFTRNGDDLIATLNTGEKLTITGEFNHSTGYTWNDIEEFEFADGSKITKEQIQGSLTSGSGTSNDHIVGFATDDILDGGAGDDFLEGRDGSDTYRFGLGGGHDTIVESVTQELGNFDRVVFGAGIVLADLGFAREGKDLVITVAGTSDALTIIRQFDDSSGYTWNDIEEFELTGGPILTKRQVQDILLEQASTAGDDQLLGFSDGDTIDGGLGNDLLRGEDGDDTYVFDRGYGQDEITEYNASYADRVAFGPGILPSDLKFARSGSDLIITVIGTNDSLKINGQFEPYSGYFWSAIEQFTFTDGTSWTTQQVQSQIVAALPTTGDDQIVGFEDANLLNGFAGNDVLFGKHGEDILVGGTGDDVLHGEGGDDIYRFDRGDGHDFIQENVGGSSGGTDRVELGEGIAPSDVVVTASSNWESLTLSIAGTDDSITLGYGIVNSEYRVESVHFADGTIWSHADLMAKVTVPTAGADTFIGTYDGDTLAGGGGNDTLRGRGGDDDMQGGIGDDWIDGGVGHDILAGGTGNDFLSGGGWNDVYRYARGDGHDVVQDYVEWASGWAGTDAIEFGPGILPQDVVVGRINENRDYVLYVDGGEGSITIPWAVTHNSDYWIEEIRFADGTVWTGDSLDARLVPGTNGNDQLTGTAGVDSLRGLGGDDRLAGGDDTDNLRGDDGADRILGDGGSDQVQGDGGDDLLFGDSVIHSAIGSNLLVNGSFEQSGTYLGGGGWGVSSADLPGWTKANSQGYEQVYSGYAGVAATDGSFWLDLDSAGGSGSNMDISQTVSGLAAGEVFLLQFDHANRTSADSGAFAVYWNGVLIAEVRETGATMQTKSFEVTAQAGNNVVTFKALGAEDNGGASLDNVRLFATTITTAGSGNDTLDGGAGNDQLTGGAGNDTLVGGAGNDVYHVELGDGHDVIDQSVAGGQTVGTDILAFGTGITPGAVSVTASGADLLLRVSAEQTVRLLGAALDPLKQIGSVTFAGGTVWAFTDLIARAGVATGTAGNDSVTGTANVDGLFGLAGNDTLLGMAGNDMLAGGTGTDTLTGGGGDDVYRYEPGDGADTVNDYGSGTGGAGGTDTLEFGTGIAPGDVTVAQVTNGQDLILTFAGGGSVKLQGSVLDPNKRIEQGRFADGTVWTHAELMTRSTTPTSGNDSFFGDADANTISGGAGNDTLAGRSGDDRLIGGLGSDTLIGANGGDTYVFAAGDGQDFITGDARVSGVTNTLELGAGILPALVTVGLADTGRDIVIGFSGSTDTVTIDDMNTGTGSAIDRIVFADGTIWTYADIRGRAIGATTSNDSLTGTASADWMYGLGGNDTLLGMDGNDMLAGGTATDTLTGGGGDDVYRYELGDGTDTVNDHGTGTGGVGGNDTLEFGAGIAPGDVTVTQATSGQDLILTLSGGGSVALQGSINDANKRIEQVRFADGTVWLHAELMTRSVTPTSGNDSFYGDADDNAISGGLGNDTLTGRGGNDTLDGGAGVDTMIGGAGNDIYYIETVGEVITEAAGEGIDTIYSTINRILPPNVENLYLTGTAVISANGNALDNLLVGNSALNSLDGSTGADTMRGMGGNDGYVVDNIGDVVDESVAGSDGYDTVQASISFSLADSVHVLGDVERLILTGTGAINATGNALTNIVTGNSGNNVLDGGAGADTMSGGLGDDSYYVENSGDVATEAADAGTDTIYSSISQTLQANVENLTLTGTGAINGTGNGLANFLSGTSGNNVLTGGAGNDTLAGKSGDDRLIGGLGNDALIGANGSDTYVFAAGDGQDVITGDPRVSGVTNTLELGAGILPGDVTVTLADSGRDIVIGFAGSTDTVTIDEMNNGTTYGIDRVIFANGTIWSYAEIKARAQATSGNDTFNGTANADTLFGLGGDDMLAGLAEGDVINGGAGNDIVTGGSGNDTLTGEDGTDIAVFAGALADYQLSTSAGVVTITDFAPGTDGDDGVDTLTGFETLHFKNGETYSLVAPIVLDLDGGGSALVSLSNSAARFDMNGDGRRDRTSWIGSGDAFLFLDRDGNGTISGIGELSFVHDKPGATSDLDGLSTFDTNNDQWLDGSDASFGQFRLWRDANGNGAADAGEILSLQDAGVVSIGLAPTPTEANWSWGDAMVLNQSQFRRADGSLGGLSDAMLAYKPANRGGNGAAFVSSLFGSQLWSRQPVGRDVDFEVMAERFRRARRNPESSQPAGETSGVPIEFDWLREPRTLASEGRSGFADRLLDSLASSSPADALQAASSEFPHVASNDSAGAESVMAVLPDTGAVAHDTVPGAAEIGAEARRFIEAAARVWSGPAVVHLDDIPADTTGWGGASILSGSYMEGR